MLPSRLRFHSRGGVRYTYQKGKTIRGPKMSMVVAKNTRGRSRFAVVVSKKVLKSAVGRNRIRRRVYEALRLELPEPKTWQKDCIFVIFQKDVATMDFLELRGIIKNLLSEAKTTAE